MEQTSLAWFDPIPDRHFELNQGHVIFVINGEDTSHFEFTFDIAFADIEIVERQPIIETLSKMANVVESIVSGFTPFLV